MNAAMWLLFLTIILCSKLEFCIAAQSDAADEAEIDCELSEQPAQIAAPLLALPGKALFPSVDFLSPSSDDSAASAHSLFRIATRPITLDLNSLSAGRDETLPVLDDAAQTARTVWDCALVLAKYLEHNADSASLAGKRVLEMGAGLTGVPGIAVRFFSFSRVHRLCLQAAILGANVVVTDLPEIVPALRINAQLNANAIAQNTATGRIGAASLHWLHSERDLPAIWASFATDSETNHDNNAVDLVLAADVIWLDALVVPFVDTLYRLVTAAPNHQHLTRVLLAYQERSRKTTALLREALSARGFMSKTLPESELHPDYRSDRIEVWQLRLAACIARPIPMRPREDEHEHSLDVGAFDDCE